MLQRGLKQCSRVGWRSFLGLASVLVFSLPVQADVFFTDDIRIQTPSPTLTFQDNAGVPQFWEAIADNLGFDIVDSTGQTNPFTILPDAPTASLFIAGNGSIGLGTNEPNKLGSTVGLGKFLNFRADGLGTSTGVANVAFQGQVGAQNHFVHLGAAANQRIMRLQTSSGFTGFHVLNDDLAAYAVANVISMKMANGNVGLKVQNPLHPLHLASGAHVTVGGVFNNASSRELKDDIQPITCEEALETVRALQPVGYRYKNEQDEKYVGFIAEDVPELVASRDRKSLAPMDITAVLTKVVQDQDRLLKQQQEQIATMNKRLAEIEIQSR